MPTAPAPASASRLVCSSLCFRRWPLEVAAAGAVQAGFAAWDVVGLPGYCEHFDPRADAVAIDRWSAQVLALPLRVHRLHSGIPFWHEDNVAAGDPERIFGNILRAATAVRAGGIVLGVGRAADRSEDPGRRLREIGARLQPLIAGAAAQGLTVSFEAPHKGSLVHSAREALELVRACDHPAARLVFDVAHHVRAGLPPAEAVALLAGRIDHAHLRDQRDGKGVYPLGAGAIDFGALFAALASAGFDGAFSLEFPDAAPDAAGVTALLQQSREFLFTRFSLS